MNAPASTTEQNQTQADITDKRGIAGDYGFSVRTVDNLIARGMPHLKIGKRRCRFSRAEIRAWMSEQFRVVRHG
jgi:predicted DNA-binding transcriptional regulator AlpA